VESLPSALADMAKRILLGILVAVLLVVPAASSEADFSAATASFSEVRVNSHGATVEIRPSVGETPLLRAAISSGTWHFVQEWFEVTVDDPTKGATCEGGNALGGEPHRSDARYALNQTVLTIGPAVDETAVVLVVPKGQGANTTLITSGSFAVETASGGILEKSHVNPGGGPSNFPYYEYMVPAGLRTFTTGLAALESTGGFDLYVYGMELTLLSPNGENSYRAGCQIQQGTVDGTEVPVGLVHDYYYRYAVFSVDEGIFAADLQAHQAHLHAQEMQVFTAGSVRLEGASGSMQTEAGEFQADGGPVIAESGTYPLAYEEGKMTVTPAKFVIVAGSSGFYVAEPTKQTAPWFPMVGIAGILFVAAYTYPTARGASHLRRMELLTGRPRLTGWRTARAEGYAMMAAAAEDRGHMRRATWWMGLACRFDPHDPCKALDLALFAAAIGQHRRALTLFTRAHPGLVELGDVDDLGRNAYGAAISAATLDRTEPALDWLRIASQVDPGLMVSAGQDPAFTRLRGEADYASLVGPAR
jgi:hypothetical protein